MVIKKKSVFAFLFLFLTLHNEKINYWSCILKICTWGSSLWYQGSRGPGVLTQDQWTYGVHRWAQVDGRCDPPETTLMIFRACVFMGDCPQHDQTFKAALSPTIYRGGGWMACPRLHSRLMAELGCDSPLLRVPSGGYWKLFKGSFYSLECLWPKSQGTKHSAPTKPRLGNARLSPRELHLTGADAGLGSGWGEGTATRGCSRTHNVYAWATAESDVLLEETKKSRVFSKLTVSQGHPSWSFSLYVPCPQNGDTEPHLPHCIDVRRKWAIRCKQTWPDKWDGSYHVRCWAVTHPPIVSSWPANMVAISDHKSVCSRNNKWFGYCKAYKTVVFQY